MKTFFTIFITALMIVPELFCGNLGLTLGLPLFTSVYFAGSFGFFYGVTAAGCAGLILDLLYARSFAWDAVIWVLIASAAYGCARRLRMNSPEAPLLAGASTGGMHFLWTLCYTLAAGLPFPGPDIFSVLVFQTVGGGIFMLLLTWIFDAVNFRCNLPRFSPPENRWQNSGRRI